MLERFGAKSQASLFSGARSRLPVRIGSLVLTLLLLWLEIVPPLAMVRAAPSADIAVGCINLIEGGDFETINPVWNFQPSTNPPRYTSEFTFDGSAQSLVLGNTPAPGGSTTPSISEVRYQAFQLPPGASRIILRFRYLPFYEDALDSDRQQAEVLYGNSPQALESNPQILRVLDGHETSPNTTPPSWRQRDATLTSLAGQWISLRFRVRNDGGPAQTWMYVDNVEIEYCSSTPTITPTLTGAPTATGTVTWTPTNTPIPPPTVVPPTFTPVPPPPSGCNINIILNGSFESDSDWICGEDPVPPYYAGSQRQDGIRSMLLGHPPEAGGNDKVTYSSVRQLVTIPSNVATAQLRWWHLYQTQQTPDPNPSGQSDRQEVILLTTGGKVIKILQRVLRNESWQQDVIDLSAYRGQTFYIYFNVFNDGNGARTWAYLDQVELLVCYPVVTNTPVPPPTNTPVPPPTDTPMPTATETWTPPAPLSTATDTVVAAAAVEIPGTPSPVLVTPVTVEPAAQLLPELPVTIEAVTVEADLAYLEATATAAANSGASRLFPEISLTTDGNTVWGARLGTIAVLTGMLVAILLLASFWARISSRERLLIGLLLLILLICLIVLLSR